MKNPKILFISHDANRAGAQLFLLSIMKFFKQKNWELDLLLLADGVLKNDFEQISTVYLFQENTENRKIGVFNKLFQRSGINENPNQLILNTLLYIDFDLIYINTIACADIFSEISPYLKAPILTHLHELEFSINLYSQPQNRRLLFEKSNKIIACSIAVAENLKENHAISFDKITIIHSFIDNEGILNKIQNTDNEAIKKKYNIPRDHYLIGGCGNAEWRKGVDLFPYIVAKFLSVPDEKFHFIWIGINKKSEFFENLYFDTKKLNVDKMITFIEQTPDSVELINCLDVFVLMSREDPFPLVMLEAALAKKVIIGFQDTGGIVEFAENEAAILAKFGNLTDLFHKIMAVKENEIFSRELGRNAHEKVSNLYNFENSIKKIENLIVEIAKETRNN